MALAICAEAASRPAATAAAVDRMDGIAALGSRSTAEPQRRARRRRGGEGRGGAELEKDQAEAGAGGDGEERERWLDLSSRGGRQQRRRAGRAIFNRRATDQAGVLRPRIIIYEQREVAGRGRPG